MSKRQQDAIGWTLGCILSVATFAQATAARLPCERLPFTYQTQTACKILEKLNLRPDYRATMR